MTSTISAPRLERDGLVRALADPVEYRDAASDDDLAAPRLRGHFSVFNEWTEIGGFEGHFMERIAPGAFTKTFAEQRDRMRVLFEHGHDNQVGQKPIGQIQELREDDTGAYYEVELFDGLPQLIVDGLRTDQYGSSFKFRVTREHVEEAPKRSESNPDGIRERTIQEAHVYEFGPVTFPAYEGATAALRTAGMGDEMFMRFLANDPERAQRLVEYAIRAAGATEAPAEAPPVDVTPVVERTPLYTPPKTAPARLYGQAGSTRPAWRI